MGRLADVLNAAVERRVGDDRSRADVISSMASAAGIDESTVNQNLRGDIDCPPADRLQGFAQALNVSLDSLVSAAESDGCEYEMGAMDALQMASWNSEARVNLWLAEVFRS